MSQVREGGLTTRGTVVPLCNPGNSRLPRGPSRDLVRVYLEGLTLRGSGGSNIEANKNLFLRLCVLGIQSLKLNSCFIRDNLMRKVKKTAVHSYTEMRPATSRSI